MKVFELEEYEKYADMYVIIDDKMTSILPDNKPTADTLKILDLDWQLVLKAGDFKKEGEEFVYEDEDGNQNYIREIDMPEEVVAVLDEFIENSKKRD